MNQMFDKISFGVNYVPSKKWWFCWNDFDPDSIAADLDAIALLGADHIRIMLVWPFFQPNRTWVSTRHLDRLDKLMTLAAERSLNVCPAMLTGWLSGWSFLPTFDRPNEFYSAPEMKEAVELYFRACAERLNRHPNFMGFDFGNEMNVCWKPANLAEGDEWMDWMMDLCESLSPNFSHVNGVDHEPWFHPTCFSAGKLASRPNLIALHSWIEFTGARKRGGVFERACTHLAPAMAALARSTAGDPCKPVWLQEFGASSLWMKDEEVPAFLEKAIHAAVSGGICRLTWWASHDIRPEYEFNELEYGLGLITTENKLKPSGNAFKRMVSQYGNTPVQFPSSLRTPPLPNLTYEDPHENMEVTWQWLEEVQRVLP